MKISQYKDFAIRPLGEVTTSQENLAKVLAKEKEFVEQFQKKRVNLLKALFTQQLYCPRCLREGINIRLEPKVNVHLRRFIQEDGELRCSSCNFLLAMKITNYGEEK